MAIGAITKDAAQSTPTAPGPVFFDTIQFTGDTSYPTGGSDLETPFKALVKASREILAVIPAAACGGFVPRFDKATGKLLIYTSNGAGPAALAELPNANNNSAVTYVLLVVSR